MTATFTEARKRIAAEGFSNPLTHAFPLESSAHLVVYADDTELVQGVDYTVDEVGNPAGYEVNITIPEVGMEPEWWGNEYFILVVAPPIEQGHDISLGGTFGTQFENALDALTRRLQYVYDLAQRAVKTTLDYPVGGPEVTIDADSLTVIAEGAEAAQDAADEAEASATAAAASASAAASSASAAASSASSAASSAASIGTSVEDAEDAATAAAASAAAASSSASTASGHATTAAGHASDASDSAGNAAGSATAAAASATAAATSETNAGTSETNAAASATAAAASATAAATSESEADDAALAAEAAQTAAEAAQAAAEAAQTDAEAAAIAAENASGGLSYVFDDATGAADPGSGEFRLNHATPSSATAIYVDDLDANAADVSTFLETWDASNSTVKGIITIRKKADPAVFHIYSLTGSVADGTGYRQITVTHVTGAGTFTAADECMIFFARTGDKGTDGGGAGDVVGPASSANNAPAVFDGTTGKLLKEVSYATFKTSLSLVKGDVGLGNVDNTSDADKPVSTATQTALDAKAPLASPALTGTPTAPTAAGGTNTTQIATTAFVKAAVDVVLGGVAAAGDTLAELYALITGHTANEANPHSVTKAQVGLGNVDNTSDATKNAAEVTLTNKTITDPIIAGTIREDVYDITDGAGFAINPRNGSIQRVTLGANRTPTASGWQAGDSVTVLIDDGSARTIDWSTIGVVWGGGSAPSLALSGYTEVNITYDGSVYRGVHVRDFAS